jgi:hypothetical protein
MGVRPLACGTVGSASVAVDFIQLGLAPTTGCNVTDLWGGQRQANMAYDARFWADICARGIRDIWNLHPRISLVLTHEASMRVANGLAFISGVRSSYRLTL